MTELSMPTTKREPPKLSFESSDVQNLKRDYETSLTHFWTALVEKAQTTSEIILIAHKKPDLDALSSIALWYLLKNMFPQKHIRICIPIDAQSSTSQQKLTPFIEKYGATNAVEWINNISISSQIQHNSLVALVDLHDLPRAALTQNELEEKSATLVILDHHEQKTRELFPSTKTILPRAQSTAELIALLFLQQEHRFLSTEKKRLLYALLYGIMSDAQNFSLRPERIEVQTSLAIFNDLLKKLQKLDPSISRETIFREARIPFTQGEKSAYNDILALSTPVLELPQGYNVQLVHWDTFTIPSTYGPVDPTAINQGLDDLEKKTEADLVIYAQYLSLSPQEMDRRPGEQRPPTPYVFELGMRSTRRQIAGKIGELLHRGGRPGAARGELWPTTQDMKDFEQGRITKKELFSRCFNQFVQAYTQAFQEQKNQREK